MKNKIQFLVCLCVIFIIVVATLTFVSFQMHGLQPILTWSKLVGQPTSSSNHSKNNSTSQTNSSGLVQVIPLKNGCVEKVYVLFTVSRTSTFLEGYISSLIITSLLLMKEFFDNLNDTLQLFGATLEKIKIETKLKLSQIENWIRKMKERNME